MLKKIYLEISNCCNLSCSFCHGTARKPRMMSAAEFEINPIEQRLNMAMKKFINAPENLTSELLEGMCKAYSNKIALSDGKIVVRAKPKPQEKVAIITLGGAGHEPALSGFVGEGMLDASVVGDIFAAPNAVAVLGAMRKFKRDAGILLVVLNHAGDVMSSNMAMKMAEREGIKFKSIWLPRT